jgi:hypothetical protein
MINQCYETVIDDQVDLYMAIPPSVLNIGLTGVAMLLPAI